MNCKKIKETAVLIMLGVLIAFSSSANETFQDPFDTPSIKTKLAEKNLLQAITRAGERLIAVGMRGHIIYSDDKGKSWTQANVPVSTDLTAVYFASTKQGWVVGHEGIILHSSDGGANWTKQFDGNMVSQKMKWYIDHPPKNLPEGQEALDFFLLDCHMLIRSGLENPFLDVWFENEKTGFVVGAFNLIFRTIDGGQNWEAWYDRTDNPMRAHLFSINSVGEDLYIVGEMGLVLKLDRRSMQFRKVNVPGTRGSLFGVTGKGNDILIYGMCGHMYYSANKGTDWHRITAEINATSTIANDVIEEDVPQLSQDTSFDGGKYLYTSTCSGGGLTGSFVTEDGRLLVVNDQGNILVSENGGASFKIMNADIQTPLTDIISIGNNAYVLTGMIGVQKQTFK